MPLPSQTFANIIPDLINYINNEIKPNGAREIDGDALNNALNALATFIIKYQVNGELAAVINSTTALVVAKPITIFTAAPATITVNDNVQNEYYFVNATGNSISFNTAFTYTDPYGDVKTSLPPFLAIHIAKATNGSWIQINNIGGGTGGDLPPQSGNQGKALITTGESPFWGALHLSIKGSDFANATEYINEYLTNFTLSIFISEMGRFIYEDTGEWEPITDGFKVLLPGFDATDPSIANWHFELFLKPTE